MKLLLATALVVGAMWLGSNIFKQDSWDLMICEELMSNGVECYSNAEILKGYETQRECMEVGIRLASKQGYECGKNCKASKDFGGIVCETICNKAGCN